MFKRRSDKLERLDTGDYTPEEYNVFLREIAFINRVLGDKRALEKTLLREIVRSNQRQFSVLDVGAGSGELLRSIAEHAKTNNLRTKLFGLELNHRSAVAIGEESKEYEEIFAVRADAFCLPFADNTFDYAICSLFTHHFADDNVAKILGEMARVVRRKIFAIDLHRHAAAYVSYKIFCTAFRISPLVSEDGSLSILRGFKPAELEKLASEKLFNQFSVRRIFPFRIVLEGEKRHVLQT